LKIGDASIATQLVASGNDCNSTLQLPMVSIGGICMLASDGANGRAELLLRQHARRQSGEATQRDGQTPHCGYIRCKDHDGSCI
jgi:hypothetical protein